MPTLNKRRLHLNAGCTRSVLVTNARPRTNVRSLIGVGVAIH